MIDFNKKTTYSDLDHDALFKLAQTCNACQLCDERTNVVFHSGNPNAYIMIIGEWPGQQED